MKKYLALLTILFLSGALFCFFKFVDKNKKKSELDLSRVYCVKKNGVFLHPEYGKPGYVEDCELYRYAKTREELDTYVCKNTTLENCDALAE